MLIDAKTVPDASVVSTEVCVVGAGPVGLTIACELDKAGIDVVVLEAGGLPYDRARAASLPKAVKDHLVGAQSLTRGRGVGEPYFPLRLSRARGIGGSTNALKAHGLRSLPLDPIDFEDRLGAGWPIDYAAFAGHLPAAARYCGLDTGEGPATDASVNGGLELDPQGVADLVAVEIRHGPRDAFTRRLEEIRASRRQRVITSAIVTGLRQDESPAVTEVEVVAFGGRRRFLVGAKAFVLAMGGIDTPRLLLGAGELQRHMGPAADSIGRYFMEHLHYVPGYVRPASPASTDRLHRFFAGGRRMLTLRDEVVRANGLPRAVFAGRPVYGESLEPAVAAAGSLLRGFPYGPYGIRARARQVASAARGLPSIASVAAARFSDARSRDAFALRVMAEQAPHRDSRVTLSKKRDKTGLPLPVLHWRVADDSFEAMQLTMELLGREVSKLDLGDVISLWDQGQSRPLVVSGGWHHMGTTRMSRRPEDGVVDENCKVHGIPNLYIAGSSVFPTGGFANPTLSAVALAVRLASHLSISVAARG